MPSGYDDRDDDRRYDDDRDDDRPGRSNRAEQARKRVGGPAMFMLLNALFGVAFCGIMLVVTVAAPEILVDGMKQIVAKQPAGPEKQQNEKQIQDLEDQLKQDRTVNIISNLIQWSVLIILNAVAAFGAMKMRSAGSYGWSITASIISLIPCATGCCCTGMPFGLWGLIVLMNEDVKAGFTAIARGRDRGEY